MTKAPETTPASTGIHQRIARGLVVLCAVFFLMLGCGSVLAVLLLPMLTTTREIVRVEAARNQLKEIGVAARNYHAIYGRFPPPFTTDAIGTPTNSWRVLILPYLSEAANYDDWQTQESWQQEPNASLGDPAPRVYTSPIVQDPPTTTETHIFAIRHPRGVMMPEKAVSATEIADGTSRTIWAAYLPNHTTHWAAPVDISLDRLQDELANLTESSPAILLFADGAVLLIDQPLQRELVESLVTRDGNEPIDF